MRFETKIAVLLRDDLEGWQRLNVTAFPGQWHRREGP